MARAPDRGAGGRRNRRHGDGTLAAEQVASLRTVLRERGAGAAGHIPTVAGAAACAAPIAVAVVLAFHGGGYFLSSWGIACVVLLAVVAAAPHLTGQGLGGPLGVSAVVGWAGLAAWQWLSGAWADEPAAATAAMGLTALYGAGFTAVMLGLRRAEWVRHVGDATLVAAAVVGAYAACARMLPGVVGGDEEARLSTPISYWNGLGAVMAFGVVLAIGVAGHPGRALAVRAATGALVPLFALTLLFTLSRGAVLTLLIALAVLVALAPGRLETIATGLLTLAVTVPLLVTANGEEGLVALKGVLPPHEDEGRRVALLLVATAVAAAAAALLAALAMRRLPDRHRGRVGWGVGALVLVVVVAALVARPPEGGPVGWVEAQVDSFTTYNPGARTDGSIADRLAVAAGSGRWQQWEVAVDQWRTEPLAGTGAGDYRFVWASERPIDQTVQNAHSLYLEVLGESGAIGLLLLLTPAAVGLWAVGRALRRGPPGGLGRELGVAVAACTAIGLHMMGDWDWQLPAVTLPAVALGAAATRSALMVGRRDGPIGPVAAWSVTVPALVALLLVIGPALSAGDVDDSRRLAAGGDLTGALSVADRAIDRDPRSPAPRLLRANILSDLGRPVMADRAFAAARARSPRDWVILADWSAALAARGDLPGARAALAAALRLNPMEPRLLTLRESLDEGGV